MWLKPNSTKHIFSHDLIKFLLKQILISYLSFAIKFVNSVQKDLFTQQPFTVLEKSNHMVEENKGHDLLNYNKCGPEVK